MGMIDALDYGGNRTQVNMPFNWSPNWGMPQAQTPPMPNPQQYHTNPLDLNQLLAFNQGNQQRDLGTAGRQAGAYAMSRGFDPYGFAQHAQGNVYNAYANQLSGLPMQAFNGQLSANGQNWGQTFGLYELLRKIKLQEDSQDNGILGSIGGALGSLGGAFLGPLGGAAGGALGKKWFG